MCDNNHRNNENIMYQKICPPKFEKWLNFWEKFALAQVLC